jgi:hypothetical protein
VPIAAIKGSIAGLPLMPEVHYLSFEAMWELARDVVAVIDDIERPQFPSAGRLRKMQSRF